jgi:aryl-alcohol dehydrogenase-like predicted oxidoreductase
VTAQGEDVVPIPGTKRPERLEENAGALAVTLTAADLARIEEVAPRAAFAGDRYEDMRFVQGRTPTRLEV